MTSRPAEEFSAFASVDRFGFDADGGCRRNRRCPDSLGAGAQFFTGRERLNGAGRVLAIVEVDVKGFSECGVVDSMLVT